MLESLFLAVVLTVFLGRTFPFISVCPGTWKWQFPFTEFFSDLYESEIVARELDDFESKEI